MVADVAAFLDRSVVVSAHCHNDLGLATANTLAAVRAGARQVEVSVNGLGERAGNAAAEEVAAVLRLKRAAVIVHRNVFDHVTGPLDVAPSSSQDDAEPAAVAS